MGRVDCVKRLLEVVLRRHRPDVIALSAWLDGQLPPAAAVKLEAHVETCAICRERTKELRSVRAALRATPAAESRRSFRVTPAMAAAIPAVAARRPLALRVAPAVSAVAVLVFAVVVGADLYSAGGSSRNTSADRAATSAQSASQAGPASGLTAPESGHTATDKAIQSPSGTPGVAAAPYPPTNLPPVPATGAGVDTGTAVAPGGEGVVRDNSTPAGGETAPAFESAARHDENGGPGNNRTSLHVIEAVIAAIALAAGAVAIGARLRERGASR
jgi:anti-sigma factor RsiW